MNKDTYIKQAKYEQYIPVVLSFGHSHTFLQTKRIADGSFARLEGSVQDNPQELFHIFVRLTDK